MKLTKEWLKEAATLSSLYKGDDCYEEVAELKKEQNKYTAIVYGDIIYDVQIEENELNIDCFCTCDFDAGGLCEHAVAVCLNILDGQYEEVELAPNADLEETIEFIDYRLKDAKNFYEKVFIKSNPTTQKNFLQQLFEHNEFLRKSFLEVEKTHEKYQVSIDISAIRKTIFDQLLSIDFQHNQSLLNITATDELPQKAKSILVEEQAIEKIELVLNPFGEKALAYLEEGQLTNALTVFLSMFEASFGLPEPDWEESPLIDDFEAETFTICHNWQVTIIETLGQTPLKDDQIKSCIRLIFDRWQFHHAEETNSDVYYDFKFFEPFLKAILTPSAADYLRDLLVDHHLINFQTARIALHCAELLSEADWWFELAENFAGNDPKIGEQLMNRYLELNQQENFYRIAYATFDLFPDKLINFLLKKVHPLDDRPFYISLLKYYTNHKQDIEAFKELREFVSDEEKEQFISGNATTPTFYAKLLAAELRFAEILALAKTQQNDWEFNELIRPILNIYPFDAFDIISKRSVQALSLHQVDYRRISKNLQLLQEIKGIDEQRQDFIKRLKRQFRNRIEFVEALETVGY